MWFIWFCTSDFVQDLIKHISWVVNYNLITTGSFPNQMEEPETKLYPNTDRNPLQESLLSTLSHMISMREDFLSKLLNVH